MNRTYDIKPIPTVYKGVKYRSRLEARYAVLFERLGVEAYYEWEGVQLPTGWYEPDFWLPALKAWLEIKPTYPTDIEKRRCVELAAASGQLVYCSYSEIGFPALTSVERPNAAELKRAWFEREEWADWDHEFYAKGTLGWTRVEPWMSAHARPRHPPKERGDWGEWVASNGERVAEYDGLGWALCPECRKPGFTSRSNSEQFFGERSGWGHGHGHESGEWVWPLVDAQNARVRGFYEEAARFRFTRPTS